MLRMPRTCQAIAVALGLSLVLAACGAGGADSAAPSPSSPSGSPSSSTPSTASSTPTTETTTAPGSPALRAGERMLSVSMPEAYTPGPPTPGGTDDYRCFLLDPGLERDAFATGVDVRPGDPRVVHHVILFAVPPENVPTAEEQDAEEPGQGWTCFGGPGMGGGGGGGPTGLDAAPWLAAWAPGGRESLMRPGFGTPMRAGARIVMQVHYNLLAGRRPDVSTARLRVAEKAPDGGEVTPVSTMLLPAPVELPCRPGRDDGRLCDRAAAVADGDRRFGAAGAAADLLHLLCGTQAVPSEVTTCVRRVPRAVTVLGAAGHMHLLGRSIRIEANPGTPRARELLRIPVWDFDDQRARPIRPVRLRAGDTVRVTCRHSQELRDQLPAFEGQEERYVVWGEGTTDEMCLGLLQTVSGTL